MSVVTHAPFSSSLAVDQASSNFFESVEIALEEAIEQVREGKVPYAFIPVLTEEEKQFFNSLSGQKLALSFNALGIEVNFIYKFEECLEEKGPAIEKASAILAKIIRMLDVHQLSMDKFASARLNVPRWHTDSCFLDNQQNLIPDREERCGIRVTWVLKGPTTQVFVPTSSEYQQLCKVSKAREDVFNAIQKITDTDPDKVIKGSSYDLLIFHRGTIHRGFSNPSPEYPDRTVFTSFGDENLTPPIKLQYVDEPV